MAHWAEIDETNTVTRVVVTDNNDPAGDQGLSWLVDNLGGFWIQTSYNTIAGVHLLGDTPLRKNYAGIGFSYNSELDAFIPPKPFQSWLLDEDSGTWKAPIPMPSDEKSYSWDEAKGQWIETTAS